MNETQAPRAQRRHSGSHKPSPESGVKLDRERVTEDLRKFLDLTLREMNLAAKYEIAAEADRGASLSAPASHAGSPDGQERAPDILVRFSGDDEEALLARQGELLLALEYLAHRWLRLEPALHDRVRFDCRDFRTTRLDELKLSARVAAQRVRETGQPFRFNPMSSRDRRTIHLELNGAPGVHTISEGSGDRRHLVIYPVTKKSHQGR